MNRTPRLPPDAADALDLLRGALDEVDGVSVADAEAVLAADDRFAGDAAAVLSLLEARGYIYTVDGVVRITPDD